MPHNALADHSLAEVLRSSPSTIARETIGTYDAPDLPPGFAGDLVDLRGRDVNTVAAFAPIRVPTSAYNGRTARGRARRS